MLDLRPLFRPGFWFGAHPAPLTVFSSRFLLAFLTLMLIGGAVVRLVSKRRCRDRYVREMFQKIANLLSTMGFIGLVWLFFAIERVTFLQGRYWMLIWGIGVLVWVFFIWRYVTVLVPKERERHQAYRERGKYLPRKNKNRKSK